MQSPSHQSADYPNMQLFHSQSDSDSDLENRIRNILSQTKHRPPHQSVPQNVLTTNSTNGKDNPHTTTNNTSLHVQSSPQLHIQSPSPSPSSASASASGSGSGVGSTPNSNSGSGSTSSPSPQSSLNTKNPTNTNVNTIQRGHNHNFRPLTSSSIPNSSYRNTQNIQNTQNTYHRDTNDYKENKENKENVGEYKERKDFKDFPHFQRYNNYTIHDNDNESDFSIDSILLQELTSKSKKPNETGDHRNIQQEHEEHRKHRDHGGRFDQRDKDALNKGGRNESNAGSDRGESKSIQTQTQAKAQTQTQVQPKIYTSCASCIAGIHHTHHDPNILLTHDMSHDYYNIYNSTASPTTATAAMAATLPRDESSDILNNQLNNNNNNNDAHNNYNSNGGNQNFNTKLGSCMRNLQGEYASIISQRDSLLVEIDELRKMCVDRNQIYDTSQRLGLEVQHLRAENATLRDQQLQHKSEVSRLAGVRVENERLKEINQRLTQKVQEQHRTTLLYSETTVKNATLEQEVRKMSDIIQELQSQEEHKKNKYKHLRDTYQELHQSHTELLSTYDKLHVQYQNIQDIPSKYQQLQEEYQTLHTLSEQHCQKMEKHKTEIIAKDALVTLLSQQLQGTASMRVELDTLRQKYENNLEDTQQLTSTVEKLERKTGQLEDEKKEMSEKYRTQIDELKNDIGTEKSKSLSLEKIQERLLGEIDKLQLHGSTFQDKIQRLEQEVVDYKELRQESNIKIQNLEREKVEFMDKIQKLQEQYQELEVELEKSKSISGLTAKELERMNEALKRELMSTQAETQRISTQIADLKYDKEVVMAAYKKLQTRYLSLKDELESRKQQTSDNNSSQQFADLQRQLEDAHDDIHALKLRLSNMTDISEVDRLRQELAMLLSTIDKQNTLIDQLRSRVNTLQNSINTQPNTLVQPVYFQQPQPQPQVIPPPQKAPEQVIQSNAATIPLPQNEPMMMPHTCIIGKRCPCKSRPPPPARWK